MGCSRVLVRDVLARHRMNAHLAVSTPALIVATCCATACGGHVRTDPDVQERASAMDAGTSELGFFFGAYDNCFVNSSRVSPPSATSSGKSGNATLVQRGSVLAFSYRGGASVGYATLDFTRTSDTSATLSPKAQSLAGVQLWCAGSLRPTLGHLMVTSGALTYNAGSVFLSVVGTVGDVETGDRCSAAEQFATSITCHRE